MSAGMPDSGTTAWLLRHTGEAPPSLRDRVLEHAAAVTEGESVADRLAVAAERVLAIVEEHPGDRTIALDLLAGDALITLALLAQAEAEPEGLGQFAEALLAAERAG